ncbi:hypothetical protein LCGC14_0875500 [marine sediment metagenome]|uniref:Uncharacterized protein n=1 Tax=marine sediment metagenome TaxID=412755 RepID=A0A0F9P3J2_9ZZZZ
MTEQQCRNQIQQILDRSCPELRIDVIGSHAQRYIQHCMGYIQYNFSIDIEEWEKVKWPEHIVRMRLLDTLRDLRDLVDDAIKGVE